MADFTGFSEASLLYADNYYLVERLEQIFKKDHAEFFQAFRELIKEKEWMVSGDWIVNISGTYFGLKYQTQEGKKPFFISLRLGPRDLSNKNKAEDKEGERRRFEISLIAGNDVNNIKEFRKQFFEKAEVTLKEQFEIDRQYYPNRSTGQTLVKKKAEYSLNDLLNVMETEAERFVKLAEHAKNSMD
jgi:hypothetical protein